MAEALLAVTTEYVERFFALRGKGIIWPQPVRSQLVEEGLDPLDVTHVCTHGDTIGREEEQADGVVMVVVGRTCDDDEIRVEFWTNSERTVIRILSASRI